MKKAKDLQEMLERLAIIEANSKVKEASEKLENGRIRYAVVYGLSGNILGLLNAQDLMRVDAEQSVEKLLLPESEIIVANLSSGLEQITQESEKRLILNPSLPGVIIMDERNIQGLLPRHLILTEGSRVVTRGAGVTRLEGSPIDILIYECPYDSERQMIAYYDPQKPPRCRMGHLMRPVE